MFNQDISGWDVINVKGMNEEFRGASSFNQDISGWCVNQIKDRPSNFDVDASSWEVAYQPVWGTCP